MLKIKSNIQAGCEEAARTINNYNELIDMGLAKWWSSRGYMTETEEANNVATYRRWGTRIYNSSVNSGCTGVPTVH